MLQRPAAPPPDGQDVTPLLTPAERTSIGSMLRACWTKDPDPPPSAPGIAMRIVVTLDPHDGTVRAVAVPAEEARAIATDPGRRAFFERVRQTFISPACRKELVPPERLPAGGGPSTLTFRFRP